MDELFKESPTHKALFENIQTFSLSFPHTSERISHGAPTFFIKEKHSFVQYRVNHHGDRRIALWCYAQAGVQGFLMEATPEVYFRPPYVGHLGWIGLRLDRNPTWTEIAEVIEQAYHAKVSKRR